MKQAKPLTREQYMRKFSRAVRWRLPPQESEEAIADYKELVYQEERDEGRLVEELGNPVQAAHLLTDVKLYLRWLVVFGVLVYGLFLLAKWNWMGHTPLYISGIGPRRYPVLTMAVGIVLSLYWFRRYGQKNGPMSKWLLLVLAIVLAFGAGTMAYTYHCLGVEVMEHMTRQQVHLVVGLLSYGGVTCALAALAGLMLARCQDRRWLALYLLCVTVAAMLGFVTFSLRTMQVELFQPAEMFRANIFSRLIPVGVAGFIGTGVALC